MRTWEIDTITCDYDKNTGNLTVAITRDDRHHSVYRRVSPASVDRLQEYLNRRNTMLDHTVETLQVWYVIR